MILVLSNSSSGSYNFPGAARIKKRSDFLQLQSRGKKIHTKHLLVIYADTENGTSRIGITVTKKTDPNAVDRNRVRRRIRDIYRKLRPSLTRSIDLVIIARAGASALPYEELRTELVSTLRAQRLVA